MHDLIDTVTKSLQDAALEGCLDLADPDARREAVAWSLAIVSRVDPDLLRRATEELRVNMPPALRDDPQVVASVMNAYVRPRATAFLN